MCSEKYQPPKLGCGIPLFCYPLCKRKSIIAGVQHERLACNRKRNHRRHKRLWAQRHDFVHRGAGCVTHTRKATRKPQLSAVDAARFDRIAALYRQRMAALSPLRKEKQYAVQGDISNNNLFLAGGGRPACKNGRANSSGLDHEAVNLIDVAALASALPILYHNGNIL